MKRYFLLAAAAGTLVAMALGGCQRGESAPRTDAVTSAQATPVIPRPARVDVRPGHFTLSSKTRMVVIGNTPEAMRIAGDFAARVQQVRGFTPEVGSGERQDVVVFELDSHAEGASDEAYVLDITSEGARIVARAPAGLFYGAVTLWQLATADGGQGPARIAAQRIDDAPRFAWRGLMLDVARHFRTPDEVKALIDQMALHKLNTFHWHLTDDQGWRIQIKRYPKLTQIGGCRISAGASGREANGQPRPYCGFYTQDEIRDVVKYAADRFITVVPEIDLPGHAQAAIAAYPELGVSGQAPPVSPDWGIHTWLFNVDDGTFVFLENVLTEVMELFPSRYIHLGGDEAVKDQWQQSARAQARMRHLGLSDEMQLQSWFMGRLGTFLGAHDRRLIGWDEILEGGPPADATVMSWRGTQGAVEAARAGHDVVLSPAPTLYLDHIQSDAGDETPGRLEVISLKDVYDYEIVPAELSPEQAKHVLGAQANLWTEHLRTHARMQRAAFPRAAALAEITWTPKPRRDWNDFLQRTALDMGRYRALDFSVADSVFAVRFAPRPVGDRKASLTLSNQSGFGVIRYTLDGSQPTTASPEYRQPILLPLPSTIIATAFADGRPLAAPRRFALDRHSLRARGSHALRSCKDGLTLRLEDDAPLAGDRAILLTDVFDPCWIYDGAALDGITTLAVKVGQLPHNFQLWKDARLVVTRPARVEGGALEMRLDGCEGEPVTVLPLAPARRSDAVTTLQAPLPAMTGQHDLCFTFASGEHDPKWVIDEVTLLPGAR